MRQPRPTHRRRHSGRIRALLSLGLLFGITQVATLASWTDSATVEGGSIVERHARPHGRRVQCQPAERRGRHLDALEPDLAAMAPGRAWPSC